MVAAAEIFTEAERFDGILRKFGKESGVPVSLGQGDAQCLIHLQQEVDISSAAELKKLLLLAMQSGKEILVDLESATELDVTALQLLVAAGREAQRRQIKFSVAGIVPEAISSKAMQAGFAEFPVSVERREAETAQAL